MIDGKRLEVALLRWGLALGLLLAPVQGIGHFEVGLAQERSSSTADRSGYRSTPEAALRLTVESIFGSADFAPATYSATWRDDGSHWTSLRPDSEGRTELWLVDAASGREALLVSTDDLVPDGRTEPISIDGYQFSPDGSKILILSDAEPIWRRSERGYYWVFDTETRELGPVSRQEGFQMLGKFSPDGRHVSFVRDQNLYLVNLESGEERPLTTDGGGEIINGTTDWVYEEELSFFDGYRWSPDGRRIAYWRFDQSPIRPFYLIDDLELYSEPVPVRYPKAGTPNSIVTVGSLSLETGETTWFDTGSDPDAYIARMEWAASSAEVAIQVLNRHQNRLELRLGDAGSGETRVILSETDAAWVDVQDYLTWLDGGRRFVWASERDGFRHLYLFARDGTLVRQLTAGEWEVTSLDAVDEEAGDVFFTAAWPSPRMRSLYRVSLGGGEPRLIVGGGGVHAAEFSPDADFFIDRHSTMSTPPTTTLRRSDGSLVRDLELNASLAALLDSASLAEPEFFELEAADGSPLHAYMIKPSDFDPARTYPLLLYVYGGPGSQTVIDRWGGTRYLWHQLLAQKGFIVASVDNRGTGGRGRDFTKQVYMRLGGLETEDQLAAASQLGALPYVDAARIGIWGWSYGGYMALMSSFLSQGQISLGISVAPVTAWQLYDTIYTERFMRTPQENPEGYHNGSPITHAAKLEVPLLVVHGTGDDNVHFQNTVQLSQALEEANRQFSLRIYPNKAHAIAGVEARVNLFSLLTDFVSTHLGAGGGRPTS
ncbi:MAG: S9 family peptidase [Gemmatimonadales bacterium]